MIKLRLRPYTILFFTPPPHFHPNGYNWGHQNSWTLTPANSMQVPNMRSYNHNRKLPSLRQGLNILCPRSRGWLGCQSGADISTGTI